MPKSHDAIVYNSLYNNKQLKKYLQVNSSVVESGCREWCKSTNANGYGTFGLRYGSKIVTVLAHRVSLFVHNNALLKDIALCVCHKCDNPKCIEPGHLFIGTVRDNSLDAISKCRVSSGERHSLLAARWQNSPLDTEKVISIRKRLLHGESVSVLAEEYGVTRNVIHKIKLNKSWKHAHESDETKHLSQRQKRLSSSIVVDIFIKASRGVSLEQLADEYGIAYRTVWRIANKDRYAAILNAL